MSDWTETESSVFREISGIAVPRRIEMMRTIVAAVPFAADDPFRVVELGCGEGELAAALLEAFPRAAITALDGSESMREQAAVRLAPFGDRATVRPFNAASLDWWDRMFGADLVVSSLCLHHLNDAKKQYLYKAVADRVSERGALLIADLIDPAHDAVRRVAADAWDAAAEAQAEDIGRPELFARFREVRWNYFRFPDPADQPSALFHHLVWLRHAGFAAVDCLWLFAGHAVFAGFKRAAGRQAATSGSPPPAGS
jgi:tRNA (cmo5U34)-methyltransferase